AATSHASPPPRSWPPMRARRRASTPAGGRRASVRPAPTSTATSSGPSLKPRTPSASIAAGRPPPPRPPLRARRPGQRPPEGDRGRRPPSGRSDVLGPHETGVLSGTTANDRFVNGGKARITHETSRNLDL